MLKKDNAIKNRVDATNPYINSNILIVLNPKLKITITNANIIKIKCVYNCEITTYVGIILNGKFILDTVLSLLYIELAL